jgi:hypothetical protein
MLISHGFNASERRGEFGEAISWDFKKNDIVLTITPAGIATSTNGRQCLRVIQTTDG